MFLRIDSDWQKVKKLLQSSVFFVVISSIKLGTFVTARKHHQMCKLNSSWTPHLIWISLCFLTILFCSRIPSRKPHCTKACGSLGSSWLCQCLTSPLLMTLTISRRTGQMFWRMSLNWAFLMFFSWWLSPLEKGSATHIPSDQGAFMSALLVINDLNLDHVSTEVPARFSPLVGYFPCLYPSREASHEVLSALKLGREN